MLDFLEHGALKNPIWLGESALNCLAIDRQLAQSMVQTFLVENRRFKGDSKFLSLVKDPVKLESVLPSRLSGLWMRKMGDLGGVQAELECLRKPIRSVPIVVETDNLFSILNKVYLFLSLYLSVISWNFVSNLLEPRKWCGRGESVPPTRHQRHEFMAWTWEAQSLR